MTGMELVRRVELLDSMETVVKMLNNEDSEGPWLTNGVPDEAGLEDLVYLAEDDELFETACQTFYLVVRKYGGGGWYCG